MRRVVANWVFRSQEQLWNKAVVVLCDEYVGYYHQIEDDDMPLSEWIGGIIFLSNKESMDFEEFVTISDLKEALLSNEYSPRYAYHVTGVDPDSTVAFPSSSIIRLEDDGDY